MAADGSNPDEIVLTEPTALIARPATLPQQGWQDYLRLGMSDEDDTNLQVDPAAKGTKDAPAPKLAANPFAEGFLAYTLGSAQLVAPYSYIRLGAPAAYETYLPQDLDSSDGNFSTPGSGAESGFSDPGVLIYSDRTIQIAAPSVVQSNSTSTTVSGDSYSAIFTGNLVTSLDWRSSVATTTYQSGISFNTVLGSTSTVINGNSLTFWNGNDASTGYGSLLWSNYGYTQNLFGGQIANLCNNSFDVQGDGEIKIIDTFDLDATVSIDLSVSAVAGGVAATSNRLISALTAIAPNATKAVSVLSGTIAIATDAAVGGLNTVDQKDTTTGVKAAMAVMMGSTALVQTAVLLTQGIAILAGRSAKGLQAGIKAAASSGLVLQTNQARLYFGPPSTPVASITLNTNGIKLRSGGAAFLVDFTGNTVVATTALAVNPAL